MGCVFPRFGVNEDIQLNTFKVNNIDQDGNNQLPGKIEITDEYILLHQKRKMAISWPIRTLRRYGYETDIFSFEVGRRCPTGQGIFAFRCEQADQLFRLLQTNIQRSCGNTLIHTSSVVENNYLESGTVSARHFRLESVGSTSSCPHTPISQDPPTSISTHDDLRSEQDSWINNASSDCDQNDQILSPVPISADQVERPLYVNIVTNSETPEEINAKHCYINLPKSSELSVSSIPLPQMDEEEEFNVDSSPKNIKYIVLELDQKPTSPVNKSPTQSNGFVPGYSTIDFKRTQALIKIARPNLKNDIGCKRRTRHDSIILETPR